MNIEKLSGRRLLNSSCAVANANPTLWSCFEPSVYTNVLLECWDLNSLNLACISVGIMVFLLSVKRYSTFGGALSQKGFTLVRGARSGILNCNFDRQVLS